MNPYYGWPFLSAPHHPILSAVWAVFAHGSLSLVVVLPILLRSSRRALWAAAAFVSGVAPDFDHAVVVGSLSPRAMEHLGHRPDTDSLLLAVSLALLAFLLTRRAIMAWSVFAVIVAHLLFDAAGAGVYWLFPLEQPDSILWLACPVGIVVLFGASTMFSRRMHAPVARDKRIVGFCRALPALADRPMTTS